MQVITCIESKWVLAQYARHRRMSHSKIVGNEANSWKRGE